MRAQSLYRFPINRNLLELPRLHFYYDRMKYSISRRYRLKSEKWPVKLYNILVLWRVMTPGHADIVNGIEEVGFPHAVLTNDKIKSLSQRDRLTGIILVLMKGNLRDQGSQKILRHWRDIPDTPIFVVCIFRKTKLLQIPWLKR